MLHELMNPFSKPGMMSSSSFASALGPVPFPFVQFGSVSAFLCLRTPDELGSGKKGFRW